MPVESKWNVLSRSSPLMYAPFQVNICSTKYMEGVFHLATGNKGKISMLMNVVQHLARYRLGRGISSTPGC